MIGSAGRIGVVLLNVEIRFVMTEGIDDVQSLTGILNHLGIKGIQMSAAWATMVMPRRYQKWRAL